VAADADDESCTHAATPVVGYTAADDCLSVTE